MGTKIIDVVNKIDLMNEKVKQRTMKTEEGYDLSVLNSMELKYFRMMYPKSGVLFLTSEPGIAKTQIMRSMAKKLKMRYIDLRLSQLDETDVGLYPDKVELECTIIGENGKEVVEKQKFLEHIVPKWAYIANQGPTIIHFEELNRAPLAVRNAALQILLEREVGYHFKFNENVYMVSTGNLGEEDGTDVEEFDSALNGRLIHYRHKLDLDHWMEYYANEHVHEIILKYLTAHPDHYYISKGSRTEKDKSYACPRTWTFLSDYISVNYGKNARIEDWIMDITNIGHSYIGSCNTAFIRYLNDTLKIGINDILNRYPQLQSENTKFTRDKKSELLTEMRAIDISKLSKVQIENVKLFLLDVGEDEVSAFLIKLLDEDYKFVDNPELDEKNNQFILGFFRDKRFHKYESVILGHVQKSNKPVKDETEEKSDEFWDGTGKKKK